MLAYSVALVNTSPHLINTEHKRRLLLLLCTQSLLNLSATLLFSVLFRMLTDILLLPAHTFHREQDARRNGRLHISCLHIHPCSYSFSMLKCFIGNKALVETKSKRSSYSRLQAIYSGSWKRNRKTCTEETLVSQPSPA